MRNLTKNILKILLIVIAVIMVLVIMFIDKIDTVLNPVSKNIETSINNTATSITTPNVKNTDLPGISPEITITPGMAPTESPNSTAIVYNDDIVLNINKDEVSFYIKGSKQNSKRYIRYAFKHVQSKDTNTDIWRIFGAWEVEHTEGFAFKDIYESTVVSDGEWECAVKENGAADFIGGFHGYEKFSDFNLLADGKNIDITTPTTITCKKINISQKTKMYHCKSNKEMANHGLQYTITSKGINIDQNVEWLESVKVDRVYFAMLPIKRKLNGKTGTQITDTLITNIDKDNIDVSTENFKNPANELRHGINKATIWGKNSGIKAVTEVKPDKVITGSNFQVSNSEIYNKFYFDYCGAYTTKIGEKWSNKTIYKIDTSN